MTTVITRYFDSVEQARSVKYELVRHRGFSLRILSFYEEVDGLVDALNAQSVEIETARAYEERMARGGAVILVRAGYKPLSVPDTTREVMVEMGAAYMGSLTEEVYVKNQLRPMLSILANNPLMLLRPSDLTSSSLPMADWPIPLISRRKTFAETLFPRHARMANFPWPPLMSDSEFSFSKMLGIPTVIRR
jgi:hypothetical protein